jgi:spermidine/putrescine transport system ATP-binding protein
MQIELKQIQREVGITFVYVTHDQEEALTMSDGIAVMNQGVLEQVGSAEDVYERPVNAFVAQFIGISNLLPATVESDGVRLVDGQLLRLVPPAGVANGSEVKVSVRPEKLSLEGGDGRVGIQTTVVESIYLGTATNYVLEAPGGVRLIVIQPNTDVASSADRLVVGDRATAWLRPEHARVLAS